MGMFARLAIVFLHGLSKICHFYGSLQLLRPEFLAIEISMLEGGELNSLKLEDSISLSIRFLESN